MSPALPVAPGARAACLAMVSFALCTTVVTVVEVLLPVLESMSTPLTVAVLVMVVPTPVGAVAVRTMGVEVWPGARTVWCAAVESPQLRSATVETDGSVVAEHPGGTIAQTRSLPDSVQPCGAEAIWALVTL